MHNSRCAKFKAELFRLGVNSKGLPHLEQGGRNLFDIVVLSAIRDRYDTHPAWRGKTVP